VRVEDMQFGKVITTESYFKGVLKNKKVEQHIPEKVMDKSDVLNEVLKAMEIINNGSTDKMTIIIERDRLTKNYKLVTRVFEVVREIHHG
jgi:hypothetical protein